MAAANNYLETQLTDEHYNEMIRRMQDRKMHSMEILKWLLSLGYRTSRTAVYTKRRTLRGYRQLEEAIPCIRDPDLREQLAGYVQHVKATIRR